MSYKRVTRAVLKFTFGLSGISTVPAGNAENLEKSRQHLKTET
jgi:hypothetical protein